MIASRKEKAPSVNAVGEGPLLLKLIFKELLVNLAVDEDVLVLVQRIHEVNSVLVFLEVENACRPELVPCDQIVTSQRIQHEVDCIPFPQ